MLKLKVEKHTGAPEGRYTATFEGVERSTHEEFGERLRWKFKIVGGEHDGKETSCFTGDVPKSGAKPTHCFVMLCNLADRRLDVDEELDIDSFAGVKYEIEVVPTQSGGTKVEPTRVRLARGEELPF